MSGKEWIAAILAAAGLGLVATKTYHETDGLWFAGWCLLVVAIVVWFLRDKRNNPPKR